MTDNPADELAEHSRALAAELRTRGGFADSRHERLSPQLAARMAAQDAGEAASAAQQARELAEEKARHQDIVASESIRAAINRGEDLDILQAIRDGGVGHTRGEFIAQASARQDVEDARVAHAERREFEAWRLGRSADASADTGTKDPVEQAEGEVLAARAASYRQKRKERSRLLTQARTLARMDRDGR